MIKRLPLFFILPVFFSGFSNAQSFLWNRTIASEGFDEVYDIAADNTGNVYVTGMIEYLADFGGGVVMEALGVHDIFIAKYDSSGNLIWVKKAGGREGDKAHSIVLDGQGYFYITGEFEDTAYWENIMLTTDGPNNMFVARYDTTGQVLWVRNISCTSPEHTRGYGVACDAQGDVYVSGGINGDAYYDGNYLFSTDGDYDCLIVKFDRFGNFKWAHHMGGNDSDKGRGIISDQGAYIYMTGYYSGTADFSGIQLGGSGHTDIFLAKYDTAGQVQWVVQAGDTGFDKGWEVDINVNGDILVAGEQSRAHFDNNVASCNGQTDAFVAAYDDAGNNLWVTAGGGPEEDEAKGVSHDLAGNVYLVGDYGGSAEFPPVSFTGGTYAEPFFVSYTPDGDNLRWARNGAGPQNDRGIGIAVDNAGGIYVSGNYFNPLQLGSLTLSGDSLYDIYLARLGSNSSAGVDEFIAAGFQVYPNPVFGLATLAFTNVLQKDSKIRMVNALGEEVYSERILQSPFTFSVREVPAGIYLLVFESQHQYFSERLMVQKAED